MEENEPLTLVLPENWHFIASVLYLYCYCVLIMIMIIICLFFDICGC